MTLTAYALDNAMEPDWGTRPWGKPTLKMAHNDNSPNLLAVCDFKYHGLKVRGVRVFRTEKGGLIVNMPQKKFGDVIESAVYFLDKEERDRFLEDVTLVYNNGLGKRQNQRPPVQPPYPG